LREEFFCNTAADLLLMTPMETSATDPTHPPGARVCPHCGRTAPSGALAGLCPACLLKQGVAGETVGAHPFVPPEPGDLAALFPQLEILGLIGAGGMGAVYRVRQRELDRIVALKILPPAIGERPGFAERFTREARALAKLSHPGIVTIHDSGRAESLVFLLMEYADGPNLRQLIEAGRLSPRDALAIVPMICDALQYAHDAGIVHRDIKPENILIDRRGHVKVADFGLAKLVGAGEPESGSATPEVPGVTAAGERMGTPQYMAPEQLDRPGEVDHRADIYSLGVVFYQMLTGELPARTVVPPSQKAPLDARLDAVVMRALEQNPDHRYQQASLIKQSVETLTATVPEKPAKGTPSMEIKFNCPECQQSLSIDESYAGTEVSCPNCAQAMLVPTPAPVPQASPPWRPTGAPPFAGPPEKPTKRAHGWAIGSLVLAIIGLVPLLGMATGALGLLLGIVALAKGTTRKGLAIVGTVIGCLALLMTPIHLGLLKTTMAAAKFGAGTTVCTANLKVIGMAILEYRTKHQDENPPDLDTLVRENLLDAKHLRCPLHEGEGGYAYTRPKNPKATGILVWDRAPHTAMGGAVVGRNVLQTDFSVIFLTEAQFQQAPKAASTPAPQVVRKPAVTETPARPTPPEPTPPPPPPPVVREEMTLARALESLDTTPPREKRPLLEFIAAADIDSAQRTRVITALKPLLNDVDCGDPAFEAFAKWAGPDEIPDLAEMVRVAPTSGRGKEAMKLLSRSGDARAAEPIAACLTNFHLLREAKAALAALGPVAKPTILPMFHHENGLAREAARELLRGYQVADDEIFPITLQALASGNVHSQWSALDWINTATLVPKDIAAANLAIRPILSSDDGRLANHARNTMKKTATRADAEFLLGMMASTDRGTRDFAADLLIQLNDVRVAKPLATMLGDPHETHRAGDRLIKLGPAAEPAVIPLLDHDDTGLRRRAADILAKIGTSSSMRSLEKMAREKDFFVKTSAENAIKAIKAREPQGRLRR
jgi:serine/threonine protein kinase/HEAT repeat protein